MSIVISFVLPVYNVEKYLEDCVNSIVNQKINVRYEILCVEDCSTDNSYLEILRLSNSISNIRIIRNNQNSGVSFSRNEGIRNAFGKYIWFVDPDDMLYPGVINLVIEAALKNDADVLLGNYIRIRDNDSHIFPMLQSIQVRRESVVRDYQPRDLNRTRMNAVWGGVFKKDFIIGNGLSFNEKMIAQEDTLFYYEFSLKHPNVYKFNEPCYIYRMRNSSVMHSKTPEIALRYYHSLLEMYRVQSFYYDNGIDNHWAYDEKRIHTRQNLAWSVATIQDTKMVKRELRNLKKCGLYPYPFSTRFISSMPLSQRILTFLLPIEIDFWLVHILYKVRYRIGK